MSEIKRLLNSLLWEIYGRIPSTISRKHRRNRQLRMHPRLYEPRLLEKLNINVLSDIHTILQLEIRLISKYLERVLISRDKNRTQQTILYGFLDVIVYSRLGESSREMRFNPSPPLGTQKGRGDAGRPIIITDETNSSSDFNQWLHAMKMVARLPGGMPPEFRRKLWLALAEKYLKSKNVDWEKEEVKCFSEQWREDDEELGIQIVKDLHRTGSSLCSGPAGTINQAKLKRILLGYARYNPEVGYCQGFNMLGALILQVMDKEEIESIKVMIYLVEGILPRGYFSGSLGGLQADMAVFRELMTCKLPRLAKHLQKLQGPVENAFEPPLTNVFTMQWFLTMFCTCLPMTCVLRVWDLVLIEGSDVLLRTALVLWSLLEERILNARTADDFYCKMGSFSSELLNGHLIDSNGLIEKVVDLGPIPELQKLRDKHLYNISPFRDKKGLQLYYSDEEGDSDEDSRMAVATAWGLRLSRRGSAGLSNKTDSKDRIALDISLLKKQYDRLRERQRQAHIILTSAVARQGSNPNQTSIQMNQLLIGRNAIVTNNGRRLGPPQGAIPPARKPSLPTAKSPKPTQTKSLRRGETLHWRDTDLPKRRRGSLKWKDIKSDSSQSGQDERTSQLIESAPSSRSSSSEPKSQKGSLKTRQRSDSSSYSEDSDGNSSTSTSLCDEDDHEMGNVSSLEGSPMKKSKKKHSEVPHKKCLEDILNSNEKQHTVDSQIPFIQLTTMDSPVLKANKTDIDSLEYGKEDSETESNRLDYAGFVDEYSWPDMNEATGGATLEDITIEVTSDEGDFLSLSNVITSTSQLSPMPDITTYINNSNISPLRTPISTFDYANLAVSIDDSKKFDVNDEGVTNEYFERINIVERPTKLDLLYSLNEEDSIRNAYKIPSCQSSPEQGLCENDSQEENASPISSKFLIYENNSKILHPSTEELDRKMKVLLEYSNQSSLSFIAEAKHEISSGMFKEKEFDPKTLKYQPSVLVPSNRASANIKPTRDETIEHIFVIPSVEKAVKTKKDTAPSYDLESPVKIADGLNLEIKLEKVVPQDSGSISPFPRSSDNTPLIPKSNTSSSSFTKGSFQIQVPDEFKNDLKLDLVKNAEPENNANSVPKVCQEDANSFTYLTQTVGDSNVSYPDKTLSYVNRNENFASEVDQEAANSLKNLPQKAEECVGGTVCQIPSTEDLETRFRALEINFSDRKGSTSKAKDAENENKPDKSNWGEFSENEKLSSDSTQKFGTQIAECLTFPEITALETSRAVIEIKEAPQAPVLDADFETSNTINLVKKRPSVVQNQDSNHLKDENQIKLLEEKKKDHVALSYTQFQPVIEQTKPHYDENQAPFLEEKKQSLTPSTKERILENLLAENASESDKLQYSLCRVRSIILSNLETSGIEQTSLLEMSRTQSTKNVSEVDKNRLDKMDSQSNSQNRSAKKDILETSVIQQTSGLEISKIPPTKDVPEVDQGSLDKIDSQLEYETVAEGFILNKQPGGNLPTPPLTYSQNHFEDNVTSQSILESSSIFNKSTNVSVGTEESDFEAITHIQSKMQRNDDKSPTFLEERKDSCRYDYSVSTEKLENLSAEESKQLSMTQNIADKEQLSSGLKAEIQTSDSIYNEKSPLSLSSYSEDHFDGKQSTQVILENLGIEQLDSLKPTAEQLPIFLEGLDNKSQNLDKQPSVVETPAYKYHSNTGPIEDNPLVSESIDKYRPQKTKIPSTDDLESTSAGLDAQVKIVTAESKSVATKPIPSTADLEHRFRELERKLSSTSMNSSSKTIAPQDEHLKALKQSNIVTSPSIVLPNNEDTIPVIPSNTPLTTKTTSKDHITNDQPPFLRKRIPSTEDLETRFQALEIQKSLKSPTAVTSILLSPSKTEFPYLTPEVDISLKRRSDIPSTEDLENRFQALEQSKLIQKPSKEVQHENNDVVMRLDISIPSTKDLESRFEALEQRKSIVDCCTKTKDSEVSEMRFQTLAENRAINNCTESKENPISNENANSDSKVTKEGSERKDQEDKKVPSTEDLETRYEALEQRKSVTESCTKFKDNQSSSDSKTSKDFSEKKEQDRRKEDSKQFPSTQDLENRYEDGCSKATISHETRNEDSSDSISSKDMMERKVKEAKNVSKVPSTQDLETRFEALEQQKSATASSKAIFESKISEKNENEEGKKELISAVFLSEQEVEKETNVPSTQDLESRFEALEEQKSMSNGRSKAKIPSKSSDENEKLKKELVSPLSVTEKEVETESKVPSTLDLETRFEALEQQKSITNGSKAKFANTTEKLKKESVSPSKVPSTQDLETRFEALEQQKSMIDDCSKTTSDTPLYIAKQNFLEQKKVSKVPSTQDLERRFDDMQIKTKKIEQKDSKIELKQVSPPKIELVPEKVQNLDQLADNSTDSTDHKRKDLYKLESQSDETLTTTDQTSTEFDAKTESRPTSCPEYSDPFDSNIVTTDRVLKIIEENSKILHRILKKTLADAGDTETNNQSKKSHPGITDSLLALGNIFPRSDETISPSRIKSHSWIRPSITLRSDDNITDRLASIKSTIKSIDTLCEEKSFRKEKCQRYIDSLFARPTITTTTPANPSIKVDDFECKPSLERVPKRELKKDTSPRRRRDEDREEYESRVRRDMMPNSIDTTSDLSFSLANIEQVDSEVDRINQEKQVDTQMDRPLSPYYVSGYDLNKRSITPVVYIPTKLEIRHTTVTSTFYDRYLTEKHMERTFPRSKKSPVSPTITKSYLDISNYSSMNANDRSSKSAENSPSRQKYGGGLSPNETLPATNKRNLVSTLDVAKTDLHIRSCDNILLQLRSSTINKDIVPSIMVYNPLPTKIRKPPELGISLGLYKDYGSDESSKS